MCLLPCLKYRDYASALQTDDGNLRLLHTDIQSDYVAVLHVETIDPYSIEVKEMQGRGKMRARTC